MFMHDIELKAALRKLGWSQQRFAERVACDQSTVSRWAAGKQPVPAYVAEILRVMLLAKQILEAPDGDDGR